MNVKPGDNKSVILLPHDKTIKQSLDMVLFTITNFDLVNATYPGEGIRMTITLAYTQNTYGTNTYRYSFRR